MEKIMANPAEAVLNDRVISSVPSVFDQRTVRVGIIGLGYVGLPLALLFSGKGISTTGFDIDARKVDKLTQGESYIKHIPAEEVTHRISCGRFRATTDFRGIRDVDACIICVPTPLDQHREPDLSFIRSTAKAIAPHLRAGQLVILESTTYPGTTQEEVLPILEESGLHCAIQPYRVSGNAVDPADLGAADSSFLLAFSPEREDPGNPVFKTQQIPKVVGGVNGASAQAAQSVYSQAFDSVLLVSSSRVAEMTKLLENIYRCVNIAMINELKLLCLRMGIDVWEVIEAAKTKPFGFTPFYPGPGLGGHCIPIDPFYLTWKAREYEFPTRFIELAGEVNAAMPEHAVTAVADALNAHQRCLNGARILVLGVAYKKDVDDLRESPALRIIELLGQRGAQVEYNDPYFPVIPPMRNYQFDLASVALTVESVARYDAVVITTDHSSYDYDFIVRHAKLVIDTRNATAKVTENREKIVRC